jgi:hypothetical protein
MFPVKSKRKIPHTESYPLKASEISAVLLDVPQSEFLQLAFRRYSRIRDRGRKTLPVLAITYARSRPAISTPNASIEGGGLGPTWEIEVRPVPKVMRHAINSILISEALPKLRDWLVARKDLHGRFGHDGIQVVFDTESEELLYE